MRPLEIDQSTTLSHILNELKTTTEDGLEITSVPGEKTILDNPVNRSVIEKAAKEFKKEVALPASSEGGPTLTEGESTALEPDDLGFVEGEDVVARLPMEEVPKVVQPVTLGQDEVESKTLSPVLEKKRLNLKLPAFFKNKLLVGAAGVVLVLGLFGLGIVVLPSSQITLTLSAEEKETEMAVTADPKLKEVDEEGRSLPLAFQEVTKETTEELTTTTKKTVGTPATGRVTITNEDIAPKQFLKGTIITPVSGSSATFKLDADVALDAAPFGGEVTAGVQVTATKVGEEGNLPANTVFKVGAESSPLVSAKNDLAFSGGSTKQVTVATSADRETLMNKIVETLTEEAEKEVLEKASDSLIPGDGLAVQVTKETYTPKEVDAEADKLKATIAVKFTASLVRKEDLLKLLVKKVESEEEGFKVDEENSPVSAIIVTKDVDGVVKLNAKIKARLLPTVGEEEIVDKVAGKSLGEVESYLESLENVSGYEVNTTPAPFRLLKMMPFMKSRIKVSFENP